jgi:hypothetical protein
MNIVISANCQGEAIRRIIASWNDPKIFAYQLYNYLENPDFSGKWQDIDVFVYQHSHGIDEMLDRLRPDCVKISFPNIYNSGLFLFYEQGEPKHFKNMEIIEQRIHFGMPLHEILHDFATMQIDMLINERMAWSVAKLEDRERMCDVKCCSRIIREQHRLQRLFNTQNHPKNMLLYAVTNEICKLAGLPEIPADAYNGTDITDSIDATQYPASPYEIQALKLPYQPTPGWLEHYSGMIRRLYETINLHSV